MQGITGWMARVAVLAALSGAGAAAHANWMDFLFGKRSAESEASPTTQRTWEIGEFTAVRLVPREPGSAANQHPATLAPEVLRQQLAALRVVVRGRAEPLFGNDELAELTEPLTQALGNAAPADDLLLLSTNRRGEGFLSTPTGITARLFVQDGRLQVIVRDARMDFVNLYRGTRIPPVFIFGSRAEASAAVLQAPPGMLSRSDWASVPVAAALAAAPVGVGVAPAVAVTTPVPAAAAALVAQPAARPPSPSPAPAAASARPKDTAFFEEQELRLRTLKRLRDNNLISEEEYQQKRREVLQQL